MKTSKIIFVYVGVVIALLMISIPSGAQSRIHKRGTLFIMGQRLNRFYNVMGKNVTVRGTNNRIVWSGYSPVLRVSGSGNRVYADAAHFIIVSGRNNTVYWKRRYNGKSPRISRSGSGNWVMWDSGKNKSK